MNRIAMLVVLAAISVMTGGGAAALAAPAGDDDSAVEISSQATTMRTRPRIRVYPRYPRRPYTTLYPLPYGVDYPGPRAVRQCVSRLVPEYRPSGTVIVPRLRCWWAWR